MLWHWGYQGDKKKGVKAGDKKGGSGCEGREKRKKSESDPRAQVREKYRSDRLKHK